MKNMKKHPTQLPTLWVPCNLLMRLKERSISFVANFLLGIAWASIVIGAISAFLSNLASGILSAFFYAILAMIPGMAAILLLEHFFTAKAHYYELQRQTKLFEKLLKENDQDR